MKKKILYLFSDTGGGHRAAANALISAVKRIRGEEVEQEMADVFAESGGLSGFLARMYSPLIKHADFIWRALWYGTNNDRMLGLMEKAASPFVMKSLIRIFKDRSPDAVVSVHPLLNHLSLQAIKKNGRRIPFITIGMDPVDLHLSWIHKDADAIVVATEEAKNICIGRGVPKGRIKVLGLPVRPEFLEKGDKTGIRKEFGLKSDVFTVLVMGGGEGAGNIFDIVKALNDASIPMQLIVICGRNTALKGKLDAMRLRFPAKMFGFTEDVPMIMCASDLIITKGGPGAIFEAIAQELPMIITNWLPGQEEGNVRFVKEHKIGMIEKDPSRIAAAIKNALDTGRFSEMKTNIVKIKKPNSVFDIAKLILSYI